MNPLLPKSEFIELFLWMFFILANVFFGVSSPHSPVGAYPEEAEGMHMLGCLAPSSQTVGFLFINPWLAKLAGI